MCNYIAFALVASTRFAISGTVVSLRKFRFSLKSSFDEMVAGYRDSKQLSISMLMC